MFLNARNKIHRTTESTNSTNIQISKIRTSSPKSMTVGHKLGSLAVLPPPFCTRRNWPERLGLKVTELMDTHKPTSNLASSENPRVTTSGPSHSEGIGNDCIALSHG